MELALEIGKGSGGPLVPFFSDFFPQPRFSFSTCTIEVLLAESLHGIGGHSQYLISTIIYFLTLILRGRVQLY